MPAGRRDLKTTALVACVLLAVAMIFGGGPRGLGDAMVGIAALPVAFALCVSWRRRGLPATTHATVALLLLAIVWHSAQLMPVSATLFAATSARAEVLADLKVAGVSQAWRPMTLDVVGTVRSLQALLVFCSFLGLLLLLPASSRLRLLKVAVALACLMAALGYMQAAAGAFSSLRPYEYHHPLGAVGTFANRNHFACLMAMSVPLSLALATQAGRAAEKVIWHVVSVMLLLAAGLSFSRTGFSLACASTLSSLMCFIRWRRKGVAAGSLVALASISLIFVYAWQGLRARLELDPLQDLRWQYLRYGWEAVKALFPLGSGPGSFRYAYAPFEPIDRMREVYALHAHNDVLEVALESGMVGVALIATLLGVLGIAVRNKLIVAGDRSPILVGSVVAVTVPVLHSLVDYPLRTYAVMATFALALSVVLSAPHPRADCEA